MSTVDVDLEDLKALFDMCVGSMNFGSGFLDTDEVNLLRKVAVTIGVDPIVATPSEFAAQYPHAFRPGEGCYPADKARCAHCHKAHHGDREAKT